MLALACQFKLRKRLADGPMLCRRKEGCVARVTFPDEACILTIYCTYSCYWLQETVFVTARGRSLFVFKIGGEILDIHVMSDSDSDSGSNSDLSLDNCDFEPVVLVKDLRDDSSTRYSTETEGQFQMTCALCKTVGDAGNFFGRSCSVECLKTERFYNNGSQNCGSSNESIIEVVESPPRTRSTLECRSHKSSNTILDNVPKADSLAQSSNRLRPTSCNMNTACPIQQSYTQSQTIHQHSNDTSKSSFYESHDEKQLCLVCGKETDGMILRSKVASSTRHFKLARQARFRRKCLLDSCICLLSESNMPDPDQAEEEKTSCLISRKELKNEAIHSKAFKPGDDLECSKYKLVKPTFTNDLNNTMTIEKIRELAPRTHKRQADRMAPDDGNADGNTMPVDCNGKVSKEWKNQFLSGKVTKTSEKGNADLEIQIGNVRSVSRQNEKISRQKTSNQWVSKIISTQHRHPSKESSRFLENPEQVLLDDQEINSPTTNDDDATNCTAQAAANQAFVQDDRDSSNRYPGSVNNDVNFASRKSIIEGDVKRGFFLPENSEIHRLHCEEIKSRISANQAKFSFFKSELEKSRLEQKLLISKLKCDQRMPLT